MDPYLNYKDEIRLTTNADKVSISYNLKPCE